MDRTPLAKDQSSQCDEAAARSHVASKERGLTDREVRTADSRQSAGQHHADISHAIDGHAGGVSSFGILADRAQTQTERCAIQHVARYKNHHQGQQRNDRNVGEDFPRRHKR